MSDETVLMTGFAAIIGVIGLVATVAFAVRGLAWIGRVRRASVFFPPTRPGASPEGCEFDDCGAPNPPPARYCRRCGRSLRTAPVRNGTRAA